MKIKVSKAAQRRINEIADKNPTGSRTIIFGVRGGGCSGFSYQFDFATGADHKKMDDLSNETFKKEWKVFGFHQFEILVNAKCYLFLNGIEIDWVDGLMGSHFVFNNPNVDSACGCGESVSFNKGTPSKEE